MTNTVRIILGAVASLAIILLPLGVTSETVAYFIALAAIWVIFAVGFDFAFGVAGLLSFGHAAFFGVGGYVLGLLTLDAGVSFFPALLLATLGGAMLALIFVAISLRIHGIFFAIFTLMLAQLLSLLVSTRLRTWTGGVDGIPGVPRPELLGINFWDNWNFAALVTAVAVVLIWLSALLRASPFGQVLHAVRQNRDRARQIGYNVNLYSALAFMISGAYSGLAGGLNASLISFISPESLHSSVSLDVMVSALIGGAGTTFGPVFGAIFVQGLYTLLSKDNVWMQASFGILLILVAIYFPKGLWGYLRLAVTTWRTKP
ncbi:MAG: branched-chain amino acid ABC transporter permease [Mesorhizobium sp.]|nr:branched-chain amino acid ABC transporter permease [Mesorhizobium sp.]